MKTGLASFEAALKTWYFDPMHPPDPDAWKAGYPEGYDWQRRIPPGYEPLVVLLSDMRVAEGYCAVHNEVSWGSDGCGGSAMGTSTTEHWFVDGKPVGSRSPQVIAWAYPQEASEAA